MYELKIESRDLFVNGVPLTERNYLSNSPHPLSKILKREPGEIRVAGISTTAMNRKKPRKSTSEKLLEVAIGYAKEELRLQTIMIRLNDLNFKNCEGYYSKSVQACTWPCSITQMDKAMKYMDRLE
jgi:hypothetical protein